VGLDVQMLVLVTYGDRDPETARPAESSERLLECSPIGLRTVGT
jgi:hypothetical protein